MNTFATISISMILLVLAASLPHNTVRADYNIALGSNQFKVLWKINAWQNLTGFTGVTTTVFPANVSISLNGTELSAFTASLQQTLQAKVSGVTIDQPSVQITSSGPTYSCQTTITCPLQWLNLTARFNVNESPSVQRGEARYDLSWKAFKIGDDLKAGGVSFNNIGEKYLVSALIPFVNFPNGIGRSMAVTIGKLPVSNFTYVTPTSHINLLDTSPLNTPLEGWNLTRDLIGGTQTWTSPETAGFNVVGALRFTEAGSITSFNYIARTEFSAQVSTPVGASAKNDILFVDTSGNIWEKTSFSIILATIGVLLGAVVLERRVAHETWVRRKAKKRT
jgi:hypothetical protein